MISNTDKVLEVGSGYVDWMIVIRRVDQDTLGAAIGPVFSYYEFPWPIKDRLDDAQWQALLAGPDPVERPGFISEIYSD